jgi:hypothetical protein
LQRAEPLVPQDHLSCYPATALHARIFECDEYFIRDGTYKGKL